jgi:repressor LexA
MDREAPAMATKRKPPRPKYGVESLTPAQAAVLDFIRSFIALHGYPPTNGDISTGLGFRSRNGSTCHLRALVRKKVIRASPTLSRAIQIIV